MTAVLEHYHSFIFAGDPYVRQFFLLRTITPMLSIVTAYILFVTYLGPAIMKHRKPVQMRKLIIVYNFTLVAYYAYFLLKGIYFMYKLGFSTFCDSTLDSRNNPFVASFYLHGYEMYMVRYIELVDTVFMVLSKKFNMITPLHVFHHSVVPVFGWFGFRSEKSGYLAAFMGINSFIHIIMYTYYAVAALGPEYHKYLWWKKYLTFLQIAQFMIITVYLLIMYAIGCVTSKLIISASVVLSVLFFFLFIDYYKNAFTNVGQKKRYQNGSMKLDKKLSIPKTE